MITFKMVKDEDKKHSVKFKPATEADAKFCTSLYLMRPHANLAQKITVNIEDNSVNLDNI